MAHVLTATVTAILTFLTVFCASICPYRWYKILISLMFTAVVTFLVSATF